MTSDTAIYSDAGVSRETREKLLSFSKLVEKWNRTINLVSRASVTSIMQRHIADSVQLLSVAPDTWKNWVDLGSGGGFPGLVVAICSASSDSDRIVTLVESDVRKSVFLREAARTFGAPVRIINERIECVQPLGADVVSARALAPLSSLCGYADRHLNVGGVAIFPKGANYTTEIADARLKWTFDFSIVPSKTAADAGILLLKDITNV